MPTICKCFPGPRPRLERKTTHEKTLALSKVAPPKDIGVQLVKKRENVILVGK